MEYNKHIKRIITKFETVVRLKMRNKNINDNIQKANKTKHNNNNNETMKK